MIIQKFFVQQIDLQLMVSTLTLIKLYAIKQKKQGKHVVCPTYIWYVMLDIDKAYPTP